MKFFVDIESFYWFWRSMTHQAKTYSAVVYIKSALRKFSLQCKVLPLIKCRVYESVINS